MTKAEIINDLPLVATILDVHGCSTDSIYQAISILKRIDEGKIASIIFCQTQYQQGKKGSVNSTEVAKAIVKYLIEGELPIK